MTCEQRRKLFDEYYECVSAYFSMLNCLLETPLWSPAECDEVQHARKLAQDARISLERHEREHG